MTLPDYDRDQSYTEYEDVYDYATKQHLDTLAVRTIDQLDDEGSLTDTVEDLLLQIDQVAISLETERDEVIGAYDNLLEYSLATSPSSTALPLLHELSGRQLTEQPVDTLRWVTAALQWLVSGADERLMEDQQHRMSEALRMVV